MTATAQDFTTYAGDAIDPVFTVKNSAGTAIDISTVTEIVWTVQRDFTSAAVLTKRKTTGGVSFVNTGSDGKFQAIIASGDTSALTGYYLHLAKITDALGNVSTVAIGRVQIGRAPVWTYSGDPSLSDRDKVRFWIKDTDDADPLLMDPEIDYVLSIYPDPIMASAQCCRAIAAKFAQKVNRRVGDLSINYSDRQKHYLDLAAQFEQQGAMNGLSPYSGGTSLADIVTVEENTDRAAPSFRRGQFDNPSGLNNQVIDGEWGILI